MTEPASEQPQLLGYATDDRRLRRIAVRFLVWRVVIYFLIAIDFSLLVAGSLPPPYRQVPVFPLCGLAGAALFLLWWLLHSTPPDAIRLRPHVSLIVIVGVNSLLSHGALFLQPTRFAVFSAAAWTAACSASLLVAFTRERSLWWATLFAWHPAGLILLTGSIFEVRHPKSLWVGAAACLGASLCYRAPSLAASALVVAFACCAYALV